MTESDVNDFVVAGGREKVCLPPQNRVEVDQDLQHRIQRGPFGHIGRTGPDTISHISPKARPDADKAIDSDPRADQKPFLGLRLGDDEKGR